MKSLLPILASFTLLMGLASCEETEVIAPTTETITAPSVIEPYTPVPEHPIPEDTRRSMAGDLVDIRNNDGNIDYNTESVDPTLSDTDGDFINYNATTTNGTRTGTDGGFINYNQNANDDTRSTASDNYDRRTNTTINARRSNLEPKPR